MTSVANHRERNVIHVQLRQNVVLKEMTDAERDEFERHLDVVDCSKGDERDIETSYAAWRLNTPTPYSIVCVTKARVAKLPMPKWVAFMDEHPRFKECFEYEVMRLMSEIMAHTITLHLLDAPGRVHRFLRKHPELADRIPKKELAAHLNLSAETLSRLKQRGKI